VALAVPITRGGHFDQCGSRRVKVEGRKSHAELNPEMVALAWQLRRKRPKGGQRSLREISRELAAASGILERANESGAHA
jgi:hypothetical protein